MNKHKKSWLIFGIIMVLLVGGITVRYVTVKQSQANAANEERRAQERVALWVVQHYSGVEKIKVDKYKKPTWPAGNSDIFVHINNHMDDDQYSLGVGFVSNDGTADNVDHFLNPKYKLQISYYMGNYQKELQIKENYDKSRTLKDVKVVYK